MKDLVFVAVFIGAMLIFVTDILPKINGGPLDVKTSLAHEGTRLNLVVSNPTDKPLLLRELSCKPIGSGEVLDALKVIQVEQTIQPGQQIELSTNVEMSVAQFRCKQVTF